MTGRGVDLERFLHQEIIVTISNSRSGPNRHLYYEGILTGYDKNYNLGLANATRSDERVKQESIIILSHNVLEIRLKIRV